MNLFENAVNCVSPRRTYHAVAADGTNVFETRILLVYERVSLKLYCYPTVAGVVVVAFGVVTFGVVTFGVVSDR